MDKIQSFTKLTVWQEAHQLVLLAYKLTGDFPKYEQFGLTNQMRRAVVSITSNIAEGFSRNSIKEKIYFYYLSLGSLTEFQNQAVIARDLSYLDKDNFDLLANQSIKVQKLLNGSIRSLRGDSLNN